MKFDFQNVPHNMNHYRSNFGSSNTASRVSGRELPARRKLLDPMYTFFGGVGSSKWAHGQWEYGLTVYNLLVETVTNVPCWLLFPYNEGLEGEWSTIVIALISPWGAAIPASFHETCSERIVTALDIMKDATLASKVMLGIDIASRFKHDPRGASKAKEFLAANKTKDMLAIVPNGFWDEFTQMAQMASDTMIPMDPVVAFMARSPPAKSEVASSKKIKPESSGTSTGMATLSWELAMVLFPRQRWHWIVLPGASVLV